MSVEILSNAVQLYEKSQYKDMHYVKDLEGHSRSSELPLFDGPYTHHFLLVVYSNNDFDIFHCFRDMFITTLTVHVTACDLYFREDI